MSIAPFGKGTADTAFSYLVDCGEYVIFHDPDVLSGTHVLCLHSSSAAGSFTYHKGAGKLFPEESQSFGLLVSQPH